MVLMIPAYRPHRHRLGSIAADVVGAVLQLLVVVRQLLGHKTPPASYHMLPTLPPVRSI